MCHLSHVMYHISCVLCHMSCVTCHIFFLQSCQAYWWRVRYQRGLPSLVSLSYYVWYWRNVAMLWKYVFVLFLCNWWNFFWDTKYLLKSYFLTFLFIWRSPKGQEPARMVASGTFSIRRDNSWKNEGKIFCYANYTCFWT